MKDLSTLTKQEVKNFIDSFDVIISDCNGVLWNEKPLPGVKETIFSLKRNGKKIHFVTNNSCTSLYMHYFNDIGIKLNSNDLIHPTLTLISYLKDIEFDKKIFCISNTEQFEVLDDAKINYCTGVDVCEEDLSKLLAHAKDDPSIGAIYVDMDININYIKILKAVSALRRDDVLYLVGAFDKIVPVTSESFILGPGVFQNVITDLSGRQPIVLGKPGEYLKTRVLEQFHITDPKRVIFVGDVLEIDMEFATSCGFQNLLVFSGCSKIKDVESIQDPSKRPDYYVNSFGDLGKIIDSVEVFK
ncbi:uncharacterized protein LOC143919041 [Arctopsyche grandis]|uniref:uncharacterized protein LOC143919041 n=1 Tax=Arctopsyche grandis TaxID=121162 RepID=UPI00406D7DCF